MQALSFGAAMAVTNSERAAYLEFAEATVTAAGLVTLPYFRVKVAVENKREGAGFDPVTAADRAAETLIREALAQDHPEHGIYGEEFGLQSGNGLTWVIDPIDGTRAFIMGQLHWGVLLGLFDGDRPIVGACHQPYVGETFYGDTHSAWLRKGDHQERLATRRCERLDDAVLGSTGSEWFTAAKLQQYNRLFNRVKLRKFGGDCYIYCLLAMGFIDLVVESGLQAYDIQALIPIVEGAGGVVTDWQGGNPSLGGDVIASGDPRLHEAALRELAANG